MADGPTNRAEANLVILRARFDRDLDEAIAYLEGRVAHMFSGAFSLLNPLARTIFHQLGIPEAKKRVKIQFDLHERAAADAHALGADAAYARHVEAILAHDDFLARVDPKHPAAARARELVAAGFRARLGPITRVIHEGVGSDFDALVRSTLPRDEIERVLGEEFAVARGLVDLAEANPALVRIPRLVLPKIVPLVRDLVRWYEAKAAADVKRIYGVKAS